MISQYAKQLLLNSTACHAVELKKDGKRFTGVFNGLSHWGRIEDEDGNLVEKLETNPEGDEDYQPSFSEKDFERAGYELEVK